MYVCTYDTTLLHGTKTRFIRFISFPINASTATNALATWPSTPPFETLPHGPLHVHHCLCAWPSTCASTTLAQTLHTPSASCLHTHRVPIAWPIPPVRELPGLHMPLVHTIHLTKCLLMNFRWSLLQLQLMLRLSFWVISGIIICLAFYHSINSTAKICSSCKNMSKLHSKGNLWSTNSKMVLLRMILAMTSGWRRRASFTVGSLTIYMPILAVNF